jgi:glutamyl-tRNA synthetase
MGSFRTALVAWLAARSTDSRFLLRIEDLDRQRCKPEHERLQLLELNALGLDWDEPPVRQSQRTWLYDDALAKLHQQQRIYPCFCTRAEIREAASAPHGELPEGAYPGTCSNISAAASRRRIESGERFALRLRAGAEQISWEDQILGAQTGRVDDFVLVRADGVHAYQLAVVVDDADQRIGEVVRGADLAESTPRQILLQRLLELPTPAYAHVPLVMGPSGARLAKRDHAATLADRDESPSKTLATLAHTLGLALDCSDVSSPARLLTEFSLRRIPNAAITL